MMTLTLLLALGLNPQAPPTDHNVQAPPTERLCGDYGCHCGCLVTGICTCGTEGKNPGVVRLIFRKESDWGKRDVVATGMVVDPNGTIITAYHAAEDAIKVTVQFPDGATAEAKVMAAQDANDVAVLALPARLEKYRTVRFATTPAALGNKVVAVGNQDSVPFTPTAGMVTATDRAIDWRDMKGLTQHNADIAAGSSGGPLLNDKGEVVGMNIAHHSQSQKAWAVPSATLEKIIASYNKGKFKRTEEARMVIYPSWTTTTAITTPAPFYHQAAQPQATIQLPFQYPTQPRLTPTYFAPVNRAPVMMMGNGGGRGGRSGC